MIDNRENNIWTVYVHIVPKEISDYDYDKYYVGITSKTVEKRWANGVGYHGQPFYGAIKKYGWNNIEHYIIAERLTEYEAKEFEKVLINKLDCNIHKGKYGYNLTNGGDGIIGYLFTEKSRKHKSKKYTGQGNPYYGKKHTQETKQKISEHHADVSGINNPFRKDVYQFTIDGKYVNKYYSCAEAAKMVNLKSSSPISNAALNHRMSANYLWEYEDNVIHLNDIIQIKEYKYQPKKLTNKRVFGFNKKTKELVFEFESCVKASEETNISKNAISSCARYKQKTCRINNYLWRYEKDVGFTENGKPYFIA